MPEAKTFSSHTPSQSPWTESQTLEFKASFGEWKECIQTLVAFANAQGGTLAVGVNDTGEPTGLSIGKGAIEDFLNKVRLNTAPVLYPSVAVRAFGPDQYMEIQVPQSDLRPVFAFERAFVRVGKTNQKLSAAAVRQMVLRYGTGSFDETPVPVERSAFAVSHLLSKRPETALLLDDPLLWREDRPVAALYLSLCERNAFHPQASVRAGLFKGIDTSVFLDMKDFDAPLLLALEDAMAFVRKHLTMEVVLDGAPRRKEVWAVPLPAVREALVNAVVHRDYTDPGNVQVRIFSDRLEIWSPGLLATGIPLELLGTLDRSQPRNRRLAQVFRRMGVIESFGTGFQRISKSCQEAGNPAPRYFEASGAFVVCFPFPDTTTVDKVGDGLSVNQAKILKFLSIAPFLSAAALSQRLGISARKTEENLATLKSLGRLRRVGSPRNGHWEVTK